MRRALSRRKFIKVAAADSAAVAGASALAGLGVVPAATKEKCSSNIPAKWDYAADLVIGPAADSRPLDEPGAQPIWEYVVIDGHKYAKKKTA